MPTPSNSRKTKSPKDVINNVKSKISGQISVTQDISEEGVYVDMQMELDIRREHLIMLRSNNEGRRDYAKKTFWLTVSWIFVILATTILSGLKVFILSDAVLIALITTTTLNVFGFFLLVMKYLFSTREGGNPLISKRKIS
ncbi:MAG TPA: hypothetical protein VK622_08730 [Puia sp.]|nr:hypothetical protein [Puia sp.]